MYPPEKHTKLKFCCQETEFLTAPKARVIKTLESLGFKVVRVGNHISVVRENPDGNKTLLTLPNHNKIKGSTLRIICRQSGISREDFMKNYEKS